MSGEVAGLTPIRTVDYHTAGEPFRIVVDGVSTPEGDTVLSRRGWAQEHLDDVRAVLINEPRGHADMYGAFVTPPDDDAGDIGVVFFHNDGFSTACGHGTIALVTWAIESGRVELTEGGVVEVIVDVPSGRLRTEAKVGSAGRVESVRFWNVDSYVSDMALHVETSIGVISVDVAFGGAFYGFVDLDALGMSVDSSDLVALIDLGREIKAQFAHHPAVLNSDDVRLSGMYGVIFTSLRSRGPLHEKNVAIFADGEVDRSPCGSGTSARLALLYKLGLLDPGDMFVNEGIAGGLFEARIESVNSQGRVRTSVSGSAYRIAKCEFVFDERDPIGLGFQIR